MLKKISLVLLVAQLGSLVASSENAFQANGGKFSQKRGAGKKTGFLSQSDAEYARTNVLIMQLFDEQIKFGVSEQRVEEVINMLPKTTKGAAKAVSRLFEHPPYKNEKIAKLRPIFERHGLIINEDKAKPNDEDEEQGNSTEAPKAEDANVPVSGNNETPEIENSRPLIATEEATGADGDKLPAAVKAAPTGFTLKLEQCILKLPGLNLESAAAQEGLINDLEECVKEAEQKGYDSCFKVKAQEALGRARAYSAAGSNMGAQVRASQKEAATSCEDEVTPVDQDSDQGHPASEQDNREEGKTEKQILEELIDASDVSTLTISLSGEVPGTIGDDGSLQIDQGLLKQALEQGVKKAVAKEEQDRDNRYLEHARRAVARCKQADLPQCIAYLERNINDGSRSAEVAKALVALKAEAQARLEAFKLAGTDKPADAGKPTAAQAEKDKQEREKNYLEKARTMVAQCKSVELPQCIAFLETGINDVRRSGQLVSAEYVKALVTLKAEAQAKLDAGKPAVAGAPAGDPVGAFGGNNGNPDTQAGWSQYFTVRNIIAGVGFAAVLYFVNKHVVQPRLAQKNNKKKA